MAKLESPAFAERAQKLAIELSSIRIYPKAFERFSQSIGSITESMEKASATLAQFKMPDLDNRALTSVLDQLGSNAASLGALSRAAEAFDQPANSTLCAP